MPMQKKTFKLHLNAVSVHQDCLEHLPNLLWVCKQENGTTTYEAKQESGSTGIFMTYITTSNSGA